MNREFEELDDWRWRHFEECEVCNPTAWVQNELLCPVGEEIRARLARILASEDREARR